MTQEASEISLQDPDSSKSVRSIVLMLQGNVVKKNYSIIHFEVKNIPFNLSNAQRTRT